MDITTSEYEVIGGILNSKELFETVRMVEQLKEEDFTELGHLYRCACELYDKNQTITPESMSETVPRSELEMMRNMFAGNEQSVRAACRFLITDAERRRLLGKVTSASIRLAKEGVDPDPTIRDLADALKVTRANEVFQARISDVLNKDEDEVILTSTRMSELDKLMNGGLRTRRLVVIGGRQKGRKTTLIREISVSMLFAQNFSLRNKANISFLCFENDQWSTTWDFVGTLAASILDSQNKLTDEANLLSAEILMEAYPRSRKDRGAPFYAWPASVQNAVNSAVKMMEGADLFIYDRSSDGGKLSDVDSIERIIASHSYNHLTDGQHPVFVIDYAQLVSHTSDLYTHMSNLSSHCIEWVNKYACTIVCLSQFNEAYNKETASGIQTDYIGTKGGGDLESACHTYITTGYNYDIPDKLSIHVKRQRRGGTGNFDVRIHPATGHIR